MPSFNIVTNQIIKFICTIFEDQMIINKDRLIELSIETAQKRKAPMSKELSNWLKEKNMTAMESLRLKATFRKHRLIKTFIKPAHWL